MPGFDGRGPEGRGSMTGRKLGYCNEDLRDERYDDETERDIVRPRYTPGRGYTGKGRGRGPRCGRGRGLGRAYRDQ